MADRLSSWDPTRATGAIVNGSGVRRRIDLGLLVDDPPVPGD